MTSVVNLLIGLVIGFVLCAWAYEADPFEALAALGSRIEEVATEAQAEEAAGERAHETAGETPVQ